MLAFGVAGDLVNYKILPIAPQFLANFEFPPIATHFLNQKEQGKMMYVIGNSLLHLHFRLIISCLK